METQRSQAALDFITSYGLAILIISIAVYIIFELGAFNSYLAPAYCSASPGFACSAASLTSANGILTIGLAQASGGTITINGAACSSSANAIGDAPQYGNIGVVGPVAAPSLYPKGAGNNLAGGMTLYSSSTNTIKVYCYTSGGIAKGVLGTDFVGYLWLNYTISNLPSTYNVIERTISFSTKFD